MRKLIRNCIKLQEIVAPKQIRYLFFLSRILNVKSQQWQPMVGFVPHDMIARVFLTTFLPTQKERKTRTTIFAIIFIYICDLQIL